MGKITLLYLMLFHLAIEGIATHAQGLGGTGNIPTVGFEGFEYHMLFC
jgi:hypothetical protein